jgi:hypothetical protein
MTRHLLDLGHRKIGFIRGNPNQTSSAERYRGFAAALEEAGIDVKSVPVEQGYFTFRSGIVAAERLLDRPDPPTAIFAQRRHGRRRGGRRASPRAARAAGPERRRLRRYLARHHDLARAHHDPPADRGDGRGSADPAARADPRAPLEDADKLEEQVLDHELIVRESSGPPGDASSKAAQAAPAGRRGDETARPSNLRPAQRRLLFLADRATVTANTPSVAHGHRRGQADEPSAERTNFGLIGAIVAVATIGGLLFGYDSGAVNGTQPGSRRRSRSTMPGSASPSARC